MSDNGGLDVSKVISVIMENPKLIEEISALVSAKESPKEIIESAAEETTEAVADPMGESTPAYTPPAYSKGSRAQLLGALKPYVSKERAKAIDSMLSIADILDMMRAR